MVSPVHYELLAHTIDDACGESFDKVGKMMGLPYPGGPHVERLAQTGKPGVVPMPRMVERKSQLMFSYSGLKTAVSLAIKSADDKKVALADIAYAFQEEALGQIIRKLKLAVTLRPEAKSVIVAGGVAANQRFKTMINDALNLPIWFPPLRFCSDNGAMIAAMAYYKWSTNQTMHQRNWDVFSRYPFEQFIAKDIPN
jgi:N6-L-threonylcarbamoyladenine synthase